MAEALHFDDKRYVSSQRAAEVFGYSQDYIGQLARSGKIDARKVGKIWYVTEDSISEYLKQAAEVKKEFGGRPASGKQRVADIGSNTVSITRISSSRETMPAAGSVKLPQTTTATTSKLIPPVREKIASLAQKAAQTSRGPAQHLASASPSVPPVVHTLDILQKSLLIVSLVALAAGSAHLSFTTTSIPSISNVVHTWQTTDLKTLPGTIASNALALPCAGMRIATSKTFADTNDADTGIAAATAAGPSLATLTEAICTR